MWAVHHEFDKTSVIEEDENIFDSVEAYFKLHPKAIFKIYSTTDCYGSEKHNNKLAKDRSLVVKNELVLHGIDKFIDIIGVGKGEKIINCPEVRDSENIARQILNRYTRIIVLESADNGNSVSTNTDLQYSIKKRFVEKSDSDDLKNYVKENEQIVKSWTIHHEFDKTEVVDEDESIFNSIAEYFKAHPSAIFKIYSTADCFGSEEHNNKLANDRSIFIKNSLILHGIDRIGEVIGTGKGIRMVDCPNERDDENIARQLANRYSKIFVVGVKNK